LNLKEWLSQGFVAILGLFWYWRGIYDADDLARVGVCLVSYNLGRLAFRLIKVSDTVRETLMSILLAGLLVWLLGPSWGVVLGVVTLIGVRLVASRRRHSQGSSAE
jgi:hypothetical protein